MSLITFLLPSCPSRLLTYGTPLFLSLITIVTKLYHHDDSAQVYNHHDSALCTSPPFKHSASYLPSSDILAPSPLSSTIIAIQLCLYGTHLYHHHHHSVLPLSPLCSATVTTQLYHCHHSAQPTPPLSSTAITTLLYYCYHSALPLSPLSSTVTW